MLTGEEKRFIKSWEEQRTGGKFKYYLLYILAGGFICTLVLSFLDSLIFPAMLKINVSFPFIVIASFVLVTLITIITWGKNEKRFKTIIKREIREGQLKDEKESGS